MQYLQRLYICAIIKKLNKKLYHITTRFVSPAFPAGGGITYHITRRGC